MEPCFTTPAFEGRKPMPMTQDEAKAAVVKLIEALAEALDGQDIQIALPAMGNIMQTLLQVIRPPGAMNWVGQLLKELSQVEYQTVLVGEAMKEGRYVKHN